MTTKRYTNTPKQNQGVLSNKKTGATYRPITNAEYSALLKNPGRASVLINSPVEFDLTNKMYVIKELRTGSKIGLTYSQYLHLVEFAKTGTTSLQHSGIKGMSWYTRHYQSYETHPTRSGKIGKEVGEAAKRVGRTLQKIDLKSDMKRSNYLTKRDAKLEKKAYKYDIKSANAAKRSERLHASKDLERANRVALRSERYSKKAAKIRKKSLSLEDEYQKLRYENRASKYTLKAKKAKMKANQISKQTGYGSRAMRWSIKSDKCAIRAAKARRVIANDELFKATVQKRIDKVPQDWVDNGWKFIEGYRTSDVDKKV